MKKANSLRIGGFAVALLLLLNSCRKDIYSYNHFPDPLTGGDQVAEYHSAQFDSLYPPLQQHPLHYLFGKKFDHSGKLTEIICSFNDYQYQFEIIPFQLDLHVFDKGRIIYLLTLDTTGHGATDTSARIYLGWDGRPDSCVGNYRLVANRTAESQGIEKTFFTYRDHRLFSVRTDINYGGFFPSSETDTVHYDPYGNPLSFAGNSYEYDYTRKAKQQFYCDDYMGNLHEFYLLQYLGYFPEITSPENIRTAYNQSPEPSPVFTPVPITNHQFDGEGRLTAYHIHVGTISITWTGH